MYCAKCGEGLMEGARYCPKCGTKVSGDVPCASWHVDNLESPSIRFASWIRIVSNIIDCLLIVLLCAVFGFFIGLFGYHQRMADTGYNILGVVVSWMYFALQESSDAQATLGKRAVGIVVVDYAGERLTFGRATGRYFSKFISGMLFCIGYIMILFTKKKQGLHDMIAGSYVVYKN